MTKLFICAITLCITMFSLMPVNQQQDLEIDTAFISWNNATINSIHKEIKGTKNQDQVSYSQKKIEALKGYWKISDLKDVNKNSIRYEFLNVALKFKRNSDFFIIEANKSGEYVIIQNYLIYDKKDKTEIYRFEYLKDKGWKLIEQFEIKGNIEIDPNKYYTQFGSGTNSNDIIITRFDNKNVKESFYYVYSTMRDFSLLFNF